MLRKGVGGASIGRVEGDSTIHEGNGGGRSGRGPFYGWVMVAVGMVVTIISSALGPIALSALRDAFDGYAIPLTIMAPMMAAASAMMALHRPEASLATRPVSRPQIG